MKYIKYIGLAALAMAFTACDDIEDSNSLPQTNPQLPGVKAENVQLTNGEATNSLIDLVDYNNNDKEIVMATVPVPSDWPAGFTPDVPYVRMSQASDFTTYFDVPASMGADGEVLVNPDEWDGKWKEYFGKDPATRDLYLRYPVYAVNGTQSVRMGNANYWYGEKMVSVKPFDLFGHVIEQNYYLVVNNGGWDFSNAVKLDQSGYNPYDDPNFSTVIKVDGAGYEFVIVPESTLASGNIASGNYGGEYAGITDKQGFMLFNETDSPNFFLIDNPGPYQLSFNLATLTYEFADAFEQLYTPGDANNWNQALSQTLWTYNYKEYMGYVHLKGEFKFSSQLNWNGTNFGLSDDGKISTAGDAKNFSAPKDALYYVTLNIDPAKGSCNLLEIVTVGLIGNATPTGWDGQTNMTPSEDFLTWTWTGHLKADEFKFRFNDNWDYNLGGDIAALTPGGDNLRIAEEGDYVVTLNFATRPYTATVTKQ